MQRDHRREARRAAPAVRWILTATTWRCCSSPSPRPGHGLLSSRRCQIERRRREVRAGGRGGGGGGVGRDEADQGRRQELPEELHVTELFVLGNDECDDMYDFGLIDRACSAPLTRRSSTTRASATRGPLYVARNNKPPLLVGIVSWGYKCGSKKHPGVYMRVCYYDWIVSVSDGALCGEGGCPLYVLPPTACSSRTRTPIPTARPARTGTATTARSATSTPRPARWTRASPRTTRRTSSRTARSAASRRRRRAAAAGGCSAPTRTRIRRRRMERR